MSPVPARAATEVEEEPDALVLMASPVRRAIVDALARNRPQLGDGTAPATRGLSAAQLADELDLHVSTMRFHLDQLVAAGVLTAEFQRAGVGRPRKVYDVAPGSLDAPGAQYGMQVLTELLAEAFGEGEVTAHEVGERWSRRNLSGPPPPAATTAGAWLGKMGRMVDVLVEWGYSPEVSTFDGGRACRIDLRQCPFVEVARANPDVVCGIHRGLITGALARLGEDDVEVSLEPFVGPDLCQAHVRTRVPFRPSPATSREE